jgi:hypothetical protein
MCSCNILRYDPARKFAFQLIAFPDLAIAISIFDTKLFCGNRSTTGCCASEGLSGS